MSGVNDSQAEHKNSAASAGDETRVRYVNVSHILAAAAAILRPLDVILQATGSQLSEPIKLAGIHSTTVDFRVQGFLYVNLILSSVDSNHGPEFDYQ